MESEHLFGITRRTAIAGGLGAAALAAGGAALAQPAPSRPNILFIMADDLGYADLSCYGRREYQTPVLDLLAAQGTRFTHGYANSSVCSPTRIGLITGRYQYRLRVGWTSRWAMPRLACRRSTPPCLLCCAMPAITPG